MFSLGGTSDVALHIVSYYLICRTWPCFANVVCQVDWQLTLPVVDCGLLEFMSLQHLRPYMTRTGFLLVFVVVEVD